ncbi:hypothetical protein QQ045_020944 [Rhodiola kirilowii]
MRCNGMMPFFPSNFMLQTSHQDQEDDEDDNHRHHHHHQKPIFPPQDFNGVAAFLGGKRSMSLSGMMEHQNGCGDHTTNNNNGHDEVSDDESLSASGDQKKRRLNMEQVKTLEKSFEMGNKLEPERKAQLARALGLQPRQIAIWFQNRRARWKTKQLEKDYDALKRQFDAVKAHNDSLQAQNQKLQSQILALTSGRDHQGATAAVATESFNLNKETVDQGSCSNRSENSSDQINNNMVVKLDIMSSNSPSQIPTSMPLFPTSSSTTANSMRPSSSSNLSATQLFFHHNQQQHSVKEENFSNMFCGIEDQSGFWPWLDQQHNFN